MRGRTTGLVAIVACLAGCGADHPAPRVLISEVMYHPVLEAAAEEHEFIELHNAGADVVVLDGWTLSGDVTFTFPAGTSIAPGGYLVVAKNREALAAVADYGLDVAALAGDYQGELDDGRGEVLLADPKGKTIDGLAWRDKFPWPIGADALGAGENWLREDALPLEKHRYRGRSLVRVSFSAPTDDVANWVASPLDGPTPGRPSALPETPRTRATSLEAVSAKGTGAIIRDADDVRINVTLTGRPVASPRLQYYVENLNVTDEEIGDVPLGPAHPGRNDGAFTTLLPVHPANTVVRYRIVGDDGEVITPLESDPFTWHSYFVSPDIPGRTPVYHLFVSMQNWTTMFDNVVPGRVVKDTCTLNPLWDVKVPAIFVSEGHVYDVRVRYQGSRFNRTNGLAINPKKWPATVPLPPRPSPFQVLAWHVNFPRYDRFEGKRAFNFNKLVQSCQGFLTTVMNHLFESVGVPAAHTKYVRLYVNGAYYHYSMRLEHVDEDLLEAFYGKSAGIGDLFKSVGSLADEGPYGWGDERVLEPMCGFTKQERYDWTYKRMTLDYKPHSDEAMELVESLNAARAAGKDAVRRFFAERFDLDVLAGYMAVINWAGPWDDFFQNHFLYRRPDGKWIVMPTDMDLMMGGFIGADASFFVGVFNGRSNREDWWNYLKDAYLNAYRDEFLARVKELDKTILAPEAIARLADEAAVDYVKSEATLAPGAGVNISACGGQVELLNRMKSYARIRHDRVLAGYFD